MPLGTDISWAESTFNPWIGCTEVSPACDFCYARREDEKKMWTPEGWGKGKERKHTSPSSWNAVRSWNKEMAKRGRRMRVFCASLCDVLDVEVDESWRTELWELIKETTSLDWQLLTKRPSLYASKLPKEWMKNGVPPHVWCGTTVENQKYAEIRIDHLLKIPAEVRFLSVEPLLGRLDLAKWLPSKRFTRGSTSPDPARGIQWVIVGGETGKISEARLSHPAWYRKIRDDCTQSKPPTPYFFKQWGSYRYVTMQETPTGAFCADTSLIQLDEGRPWQTSPPLDSSENAESFSAPGDSSMSDIYSDGRVIAVWSPGGPGDDILDGQQHFDYPSTSLEPVPHIRVDYKAIRPSELPLNDKVTA